MTSPVIRTNAEEIQFTVDCGDFEAGGDYRLGFGSVDGVEGAKLELLKDGSAVEAELVSFSQDHTQTWWGMPKLKDDGIPFASYPGRSEAETTGEGAAKRGGFTRGDISGCVAGLRWRSLVSRRWGGGQKGPLVEPPPADRISALGQSSTQCSFLKITRTALPKG